MPKISKHSAFEIPRPTSTGNMLVLMRPKLKATKAVKRLENVSGLKVAVSRDYGRKSGAFSAALSDADCLYLDHLNIAMIRPDKDANLNEMITSLSEDSDVQLVRPEFYMYALDQAHQRYQSWVREGLRILADGAPDMVQSVGHAANAAQTIADADVTWGIKAIKADLSPFTGRGIKVAVLDTGIDFTHPDFEGRNITSESFIPGEDVQDGKGHGTHCIGTSCGPVSGGAHQRYGVAFEADIFAGKVLSNLGSGGESGVLAGIEWAIQNGCEIISMSLGRPVQVGEQPDPFYESVGKSALDNGSLIIAAAGNDSARQFGFIAPVGAPANSPSIMAVAAVDNNMDIASFSCGGINNSGGEVNISGPGVDIFSSVPMPKRYDRFNGTSMATPHVAGVAAMLAQSDSSLRGQALWNALRRTALDIGLSISDGGAGLAQAPR